VEVGSDCRIGPNVTIGKNVVIEDGVCIKRCTVLSGSKIGSHSWLDNSVLLKKSKVGTGVTIKNAIVHEDGDVQRWEKKRCLACQKRHFLKHFTAVMYSILEEYEF